MRAQRLIVIAEVATLALGAALLTGCQEEGGKQAKPASVLMSDMNEDQPTDLPDQSELQQPDPPYSRDEPAPPQGESPSPEELD